MSKDKELKIVDEYLNYQKIYQDKYGKNTVIFMEVGHFFETLIERLDLLLVVYSGVSEAGVYPLLLERFKTY